MMEGKPKLHSLLPLDNRLISSIKETGNENYQRGFTNQPVVGDPYNLVGSSYSWSSNNVLQTTATEINRWQKGDRVLIRQSSTDKTFYVIGVDTALNRITLTAGNVYTFTNNAIERIQIAPVRVVPPNFTPSYQWAPTLSVSTGSIGSIVLTRRDFSILGDNCTVFLTAGFTVGGGGSSDVLVTLPVTGFNLGDTASTFLGAFLGVGSTFNPQFAYAASLSGSSYTQAVIEIPQDFFDGSNQFISGKLEYKIA